MNAREFIESVQVKPNKVFTKMAELEKLNQQEIVDGYLSDSSEVPVGKSDAFVHGWRNRQVDKGLMPKTPEGAILARDFVERQKNGKS